MMNEKKESQIARAWRHHVQGQTQAALDEFDQIVRQSPDDIDAHYGRGLAQRAAGQYDAATKSFETALELVSSAAEKHRKARREAYGDRPGNINDLTTIEDDRYMMLSKMIDQRLQEIQAAASGRN